RPFLFWKYVRELIVDFVWVIRARQSQALRHAEHVRVDRNGLLTERIAQDDVRRLEADSGQGHERRARPRYFAAVLVEERVRHRDDRAGLRAVEAGGADLFLEDGRARSSVVVRGPVLFEKGGRDLIHALVRALCGENGRDEQFEWIPEVEGDLGVGIGFLQRANDLAGPGSLRVSRLSHDAPLTTSGPRSGW